MAKKAEKIFVMTDLRKIKIGDRTRTKLTDIESLAESIKTNGLFSPPGVVRLREEDPEHTFLLVFGERRLTALRLLAEKGDSWEIPVRVLPDADPYTVALCEGIENSQRKDFSAYETVQHAAKIHALLTAKYGKAIPGIAGSGQSLKSTAELLGTSVPQLSKDNTLAATITALPQNVQDTLKTITNRADLERAVSIITKSAVEGAVSSAIESGNSELAQRMASGTVVEKAVTKLNDKRETIKAQQNKAAEAASGLKKNWVPIVAAAYALYKPSLEPHKTGGALDFLLKDQPPVSADFIEIDPPYGVELSKVKKSETGGVSSLHYVDIQPELYDEFLNNVLAGTVRVMKPETWGIIWFAESRQLQVYEALVKHGLSPASVPALWVKGTTSGQTQNQKLLLGSSYEGFYYFRKGSPELKQMGRSNVFNYAPVGSAVKIHPAERPAELMREILRTFVGPSERPLRILVPFGGSGRTIIEAFRMGFDPKGCDIVEEYRSRYIIAASTELS